MCTIAISLTIVINTGDPAGSFVTSHQGGGQLVDSEQGRGLRGPYQPGEDQRSYVEISF